MFSSVWLIGDGMSLDLPSFPDAASDGEWPAATFTGRSADSDPSTMIMSPIADWMVHDQPDIHGGENRWSTFADSSDEPALAFVSQPDGMLWEGDITRMGFNISRTTTSQCWLDAQPLSCTRCLCRACCKHVPQRVDSRCVVRRLPSGGRPTLDSEPLHCMRLVSGG